MDISLSLSFLETLKQWLMKPISPNNPEITWGVLGAFIIIIIVIVKFMDRS